MAIYHPTSKNAVQKTLDAELLEGATASVTLNNVVGIQDEAGVFVVDRVDANGTATPTKREYISFTGVSGSTLTGLTRNADSGGSDQDHAVGATVEFVSDVLQQQAIIDAIEAEHNDDGTHSDITAAKATITQTATTGNALSITRDLAAASTAAAVVSITQDNAGDDQVALNIQDDGTGGGAIIATTGSGISLNINNDGTGHSLKVTADGVLGENQKGLWVFSNAVQNASSLVFFEQDNASSDQNVLDIQNDGTGKGFYLNQTGVAAENAFKVYSNAAQTTSTLASFVMDNASSDKNVMLLQQDGTGGGLLIDQNGNGGAINIDSEATSVAALVIDQNVANDQPSITVAHASNIKFGIYGNSDVTNACVLRLGTYYLWVDATGDLRIQSANPSSDTGGTVVGSQS